jgi:integrase
VRLGVLPKREAQRRAAWLGTLAQAAFGQWRGHLVGGAYSEFPHSDVGFPKGDSPEDFLANMEAFLKEGAARLEGPSPPPVFSPSVMRDLAAIQEAVAIELEVKKGDAVHPTVTARADLLRKDIWDRWRAGEGLPPLREPLADAIGKLAEVTDRQLALLQQAATIHQPVPAMVDRPVVQARRDPPAALPEQPKATVGPSPLFSVLEEEYFKIREAGGASRGAISTGRLRTGVFKTLVGDRPLDQYLPIDLQNYVNELQYLPLQLSQQGEKTEELLAMGVHAAIARNKAEHCYEPIGLKTMQDGYVQIVRTIINTATGLHPVRDPFQGFRVRWPDNAKPSVKRESLDYEKIDRLFRLGVDSGYLDDALLAPLCLLSTRRIGILPFIRGCDFDKKHGVDIVRVNGIVYDKEKGMYKRVGYKTDGSLRFFVLHHFFRETGFVDWAKDLGDQFIFRLLVSKADPGDVASKRVNRLLKKAGAIGMNIEVAHSLRHGAKDLLIEEEVDDEATRLQMGHESNDVHGIYGERSSLRRKQCQELAHFELPKEIDWSMFEGLDFEAMASKPRNVGRPKRRGG